MFQQDRKQVRVATTHALEAALEGGVTAGEPGAPSARRCGRGAVMLAPEQEADGDRRQGARQAVGRQHGEHDGKPERREQVFRRPLQEHYRGEDAADGERRYQRRHGDAGGAVQGRMRQAVVLLGHQAMGILDGHRRIVDQDADRERETAERHRVEGLAQEIEHDQRGQDRERNRDHDHQGRPPRSEKEQDHQCGEARGDGSFAQHPDDRLLDEHRLIEQLVDREAGRRRRARGLQRRADRIDDRERRGISVLDDAEQHRAPPVLAHDVLLHQPAVVHLAHVLHEDGGAVHHLDRDVVEVVDAGRCGVGAHRILRIADLRGARRQGQVLGIDRVHHVERREPLGDEFRRIEVDHDLAVLAARGRRQGNTRNRRQLLAHPVDAIVVELLLVQGIRAQADLQHRHARGVELHHDRRLDAGRHQRTDGIGRCDDLRDREVEIDVRLEVDLLHRQTGHGLRFDVLDAADAGADRILAVGGDALLHLGRAQPGIAPDHGHHRDPDLREDVGAHAVDRCDAEEQDQRGHHVERVREPQRESNDTHFAGRPSPIPCHHQSVAPTH